MVGYHTDNGPVICHTMYPLNQIPQHPVNGLNGMGRLFTVHAILVGHLIKGCKIGGHEERTFLSPWRNLMVQYPHSCPVSLSVPCFRQVQSSCIPSNVLFHLQNHALGHGHGINKTAVKLRAVPPEFRCHKVSSGSHRSGKGHAGRQISMFSGSLPQIFRLFAGKPVPCPHMFPHRVKNTIVINTMGGWISSRYDALMTGIRKGREHTLNSPACKCTILHKIFAYIRKTDSQTLLFKNKLRF